MVTINLSNIEKVEQQKIEKRTFSGRLIGSAIVVAVAVLVYGGLVFWLRTVNQKLAATNDQTQTISTDLKGEDVDRILDISQRIDVITKNSKSTYDPLVDIEKLEKGMLADVYLDQVAYSVSGGKLLLTLVANNFGSIVRQFIALKRISGYKNIIVTGSSWEGPSVKVSVQITDGAAIIK